MKYFDIPNSALPPDAYEALRKQDDAFLRELLKRETQIKIRKGYSRLADKYQVVIDSGVYTPEQLQQYVKVVKQYYRHKNMYGGLG